MTTAPESDGSSAFFVPGATAAHLQHFRADGPLPPVVTLTFETPSGNVKGASARSYDRSLDLDNRDVAIEATETALSEGYSITRRAESNVVASWDLTPKA